MNIHREHTAVNSFEVSTLLNLTILHSYKYNKGIVDELL